MTPICRRRGLSVLLVDRPIELALRLRSGLSDDPASTRSSLGGGRCGTARTRAQLFEPCPIAQTFGRWVNLGATWAQNPPFSCPNKVFEECKAN